MSPTAPSSVLPSSGRRWLIAGALMCGMSVALGAFAAHGLGPHLEKLYGNITKQVAGQTVPGPVKYLADFKTAAEYQMTHGLALLVVGLLAQHGTSPWISRAGWSLLGGCLLFSGSLYALVLTGVTKLGAITPIGGVLFLFGWVCLLLAGLQISTPPKSAA